jgi:8-oxo-dGTP diphosphatase
MIRDASLPVYALGGMTLARLAEARIHGAHGIAMLSGAWKPAKA